MDLRPFSSQMQNDLHEWAVEHAGPYEGRLVALNIDPKKYPHQDIGEDTVLGTPLDPDAIDTIATDVDPRYTAISKAVDHNNRALNTMTTILDNKQNVVLGTDHNEFLDIALVMAKITSSLRRREIQFASALVVNKMVAFLGVKMENGAVLPATQVLGFGFDYVYLTLPRTTSAKQRLSLPEQVIAHYNEKVVEKGIKQRQLGSLALDQALLLGVALPGTVNKPLDTRTYREKRQKTPIPVDALERTVIIGNAGKGSLKLTSNALTMLASAQLGQPENIRVKIDPNKYNLQTPEQLTNAMNTITDMQASSDPDHYYVYDEHDSLPVTGQKH